MRIQWTQPLVLAAALLATQVAGADSPLVVGEYSIYYNTNSAATLDPKIAEAHGIQRSKLNGLLNVTVLRTADPGQPRHVIAQVESTARSGDGPASPIGMREIRVGEAVSYLGQFPIQDQQVIDFAIQVKPAGVTEPMRIDLREQFFTD
ncbi:MAG: DUF4426 domain-containing protein [Sphingobacteriia bacterium]|nr:DUF4426 domain-containing protein [Sphingobacteriia bacterium]NCC40150.1 DUF4426 domain-containing protein [Gammaproteobacteria bacterium]